MRYDWSVDEIAELFELPLGQGQSFLADLPH